MLKLLIHILKMQSEIRNKIPFKYRNCKIEKIESGASRRLFYRLKNNSNSVICMDSSKEKKQYINLLKVYSLLSKVNISIPKYIIKMITTVF